MNFILLSGIMAMLSVGTIATFIFISPKWLKYNCHRRYKKIAGDVSGQSLLDVGAAEGWVGEAASLRGLKVRLLDITDLNRTSLPHQCYHGEDFPYKENAFDTVLLLLTLHHCSSPEQVLAESVRVARKRVIVTESIYKTGLGKAFLTLLDHGFNGMRSSGKMKPALQLNTLSGWRNLFGRHDIRIDDESWISRGLHRQRRFILTLNRKAGDHDS